MLTLSPAAVVALAGFLRTAPALKTLPPDVRKRALSEEEELAYRVMPVVIPADPARGPMGADGADEAELS